MRLDLADLRLFIAIVDTGSITGGAANAHLALASASERLRKMEAEIGVPLLHRHARGVTMTEAGEVLARHARPLLAQQQRLRQAMHAFACGQRGTLRLFANTSAMSAFLPGKLAAWMAAHPAVQIETEERTSADIVSCILAGVAQAGVVSDAVDPGPLRLDPVADDPLVLIVPPRQLALWPKNRKWRLRRCSTSRWSPSIRPVRYSSISNSTQLNSARR